MLLIRLYSIKFTLNKIYSMDGKVFKIPFDFQVNTLDIKCEGMLFYLYFIEQNLFKKGYDSFCDNAFDCKY